MSRFLFVVPPLTGHTNPAVSVARALESRGHEIAWVAHPGKVKPLLPAGARLFALDDRVPEDLLRQKEEQAQRVRGLEGFRFLWEDFLLPLARGMRAGVEESARAFAPDLMIVDQQALAGALAARCLGLRWATLSTTSASVVEPLLDLPKVLAWRDERLADMQREAGLEPLAEPDRSPSLVVVFSTPALVGEAAFPPHYAFVGPAFAERPAQSEFPWEQLDPARPSVLVTLGTVNAERGAMFYRAVAAACAGAAFQAVLVAPEALCPPLPANVIRRDHVPQVALLERMQAVVCHGGHNTVCESLARGLPLVVVPIKDDQPVIAGQVTAAGAGLRLKFGRMKPARLREAVQRVLEEPAFRQAAARIAASFAAAGGAQKAAELLEGAAISAT